ncbi:MAG TPA: S1 RNA-binding domain-containing protein [Candidatus Scybalocola faecipullorum]|nr:S1 RNA-binding domain-containing protein [Candidatus Scybalocola faecipullorum]
MEEKEVLNTETAESMDDYKESIDASFKKIKEGDVFTCQVVGVSETEVTVDLNSYCEGIIKKEEFSGDPSFSLKSVNVGDTVTAVVISEDDGSGNVLLSKKQADADQTWADFARMMEDGTVLTLKVGGVVNAGVIVYVDGVRGFIPASQLSLTYVEDLNEWLNKTVEAKIITADRDKNRLVLSAKAVAQEKAAEEKANKINQIKIGDVFEGTVDKITSYGAFIKLSDDVSGLLHISQISQKRIKSVHEVLKEGDTVKVKVIANKDGKLSLSAKALQENTEVSPMPEDTPKYKSDGEATTTLGSLLANIKL